MAMEHLAVVVVTQRPLARALAQVLAESGYAPRLFGAVSAGLDAVRAQRPAVLLLDGDVARQTPDVTMGGLTRLTAALEVPVISLPATLARFEDEALLVALTRSFLGATLPATGAIIDQDPGLAIPAD